MEQAHLGILPLTSTFGMADIFSVMIALPYPTWQCGRQQNEE
jgi:hypothetical protein